MFICNTHIFIENVSIYIVIDHKIYPNGFNQEKFFAES